MDVPSANGQVHGTQQAWSSHPAHQLHQLGTWAAQNAPNIVNIPDRYEQFRLEDDQKKIEQAEDPRTSSTTIFTFNKEDHTLGNLLRDQLLKNPRVLFAAYKVPHPLNATFELRVQTDGQIKPSEALKAACADIIKDLVLLQGRFRHEFEVFKLSKAGQGGSNGV